MNYSALLSHKSLQYHVLVLRTMPYGDNDLIFSLISAESGRISAFAKNGKNSRKRFPAGLSAGAEALAILAPPSSGSDLWRFKEATQINHWPWMGAEEKRLPVKLCGAYLLDLLNSFSPAAIADERLFSLAMLAMNHLSSAPNILEFAGRFQLRLLQIHGICPDFATCNHCQKPLPAGPIWPFGDGIIGSCCKHFLPVDPALSCPEEVRLALALLFKGARPAKEALGFGALNITRELLSSHFQRRIKSAAIFEKMLAPYAHLPTQQKAQ